MSKPKCEVCGGNCGQCGTSQDMGVPADFNKIIAATVTRVPPKTNDSKIKSWFTKFLTR